MSTRPELVAPAGSPEKLRVALHFGADAVYLGLKRFSLRTTAENFDWDELEWALAYARERGRRVYVAVNVQPFDPELSEIEPFLCRLAGFAPDGVVVADPGVLRMARRVAPGLGLHLSTQASVTNAEAARFWFDQGIRRIVLARELSLEQLLALGRSDLGGELETFVHGAVCVGWSGRCFLSLYWAHRDPRHGHCAQACRWPYVDLAEARFPERVHRLEEDERGTYFFDARDLCALPVLDRLLATGVAALKIEGRTRGAAYLGVTVDVYRQAVDLLTAGDLAGFYAALPRLQAELGSVAKRGFSTHFLTGEQNDPATYLPGGSPTGESRGLGAVIAAGEGYLDLRLTNPLAPGEALELLDRGLRRELHTPERLVTPDGTVLARGRAGDVLRLQGRFVAGVGALARRPAEGQPG